PALTVASGRRSSSRGAERLGERAERCGSVRQAVFFIKRQLGHRTAGRGDEEQRVVAETVVPPRRLQDLALAGTVADDLESARRIDEHRHAAEPRLALRLRNAAEG